MSKAEKSATSEEVVTSAQNNNGLTLANQRKAMLQAFETVDDSELIELTSNILKLEAGEVWNGVVLNEKQTMKSTDEDGKDYDGYVGYNAAMEKTILSDAVIIGAMDDNFSKYPNLQHCLVRVSCKGMKKSAKDSKKEYRDLTVRIAAPQQA